MLIGVIFQAFAALMFAPALISKSMQSSHPYAAA